MHVIRKTMATITDEDFDYGPHGGFTAVLSTPSLDRDGDRLAREAWIEPLPERLPLDIDHGMTVSTTVGSFEPYWDGDALMMRAYFASTQQAQDTRTLVDEKHIRTVSVAFMNDKAAQKDGKPHRELLNAGIVAIPSNRDAVILNSKTLEELQVKAGAGNGDIALLQAIHDAAVHLGAQCAACEELHASDVPAAPAAPAKPSAAKSLESFVVGKAVSGSLEDLQSRLCDALRATCEPRSYPWVRATFMATSNSGTVVYSLDGDCAISAADDTPVGTYARDFSDDGVTITLSDSARPVSLVTSVVDKPEVRSADSVETKETTEMLTPDITAEEIEALGGLPEGVSFEQFKAALTAVCTKTSSPEEAGASQDSAESPAAKEPAPAKEAAAASEEAAEEAAEKVTEEKGVDPKVLELLIFATES